MAEGTTRIGVAIDIPEPWGSALTRRRDATGDPQAAYTPAHVTLLGPTEIRTPALPEVEKHLEAVASSHQPFAIHLRGTGTFRPVTEVVFVTLAAGISECELLAAAITASDAINRDTRFSYHPHVTVAQDVSADALEAVFEDLAGFSARFDVGGFTLFSHGGAGPGSAGATFRWAACVNQPGPAEDPPGPAPTEPAPVAPVTGVNAVDRAYAAVESQIMVLRHRSKYFDHLCRALLRYDEVLGGRLAAAIAYYGFFAVFALALIGYSVFGFLIKSNNALFRVVQQFLGQNLPFLDVQAILDSGKTVGIVGIVGLVFTGIGWVEAIRSSQRLIWRLNEQPGYFGVRQAVDLLVMIGILLLLGVSVFAVYGLESLLEWIAGGHVSFLRAMFSLILTLGINMLLAAALLAAVPRLRMTVRRLAPPVLQVGIGITLLNTVGRSLVGLVERNPAYGLVASAVGVLVYLYVFNQLLLFGAAWAATSPHGRVVDLSADDKKPQWDKMPGFGTTARNDGLVGTLVTLHLPPDSPVANLPWIITIGALDDDEEWEPLVCGPYERPHALALAQAVVADEDLMAVVEPLLPLADAAAIRDEIELARSGRDPDTTATELDGGDGPLRTTPGRPPSEAEVRAGFARIAATLTSGA